MRVNQTEHVQNYANVQHALVCAAAKIVSMKMEKDDEDEKEDENV